MNTTITPWLYVKNGKKAIDFYLRAFQAEEIFHLDGDAGTFVSRLAISGAEFWITDESDETPSPTTLGKSTSRFIMTVPNLEQVFDRAVEAGAKVIFPVGEENGWKLGRIEDPFGHHWEIGHELKGQ
jgi:PhnB protein